MNAEGIIGVVGGVGPYAGLDLMRKIYDQTVAACDQDYPPVINLSMPGQILDRTEFLLGETAVNPAYAFADQVETLAHAGATVAAIPCNTAHAPPIFNVLQAELTRRRIAIQFLHLIEETAVFLKTQCPSVKRVGVLATNGTYRLGVYAGVLAPRGYTVLMPPPSVQEKFVHPAIYSKAYGIKARGSATDRARQDLLKAADYLHQAGAEALILGCTELPLAITEPLYRGMPVVDTTLVLARALVHAVRPAQLKPLPLQAVCLA